MRPVDVLTDDLRRRIREIARERGATSVRVFGSVARGDDGPDSDLDLLVTLRPGTSLWDLIGMNRDVEELVGRKVDVATENGLKPLIRDRVLAEAVPLCGGPLPRRTGGMGRVTREERDRLSLDDIYQAAGDAIDFNTAGRQAFFTDKRTQAATVRQLEVAGEAVKRLSAEAKAAAPGVLWGKIAGTRDKLIHNYDRVDLNVVWDIVENDLPPLREAVQRLLARYDAASSTADPDSADS